MTPSTKPKVLIVDDDHYTRTLLDRLIGKTADVRLAADGAEARKHFAADDFNLVLMDQRLPADNGIELLREFRARRPRLVGILMTGFADVREAVAAVREGVFDYLNKPFEDLETLEAVIGKALELDRAYREIDDLRARLGDGKGAPPVIGHSPAMEQMLGQVRQVAGLDTTVLLRARAAPARTSSPSLSMPGARARPSPSWKSIAARCRNRCWRACCSATRRAPSPAPASPVPAISKSPMAATCSSTKSPT